MQTSIFNLRVPLPERDEVFLMNTLTDAQLVVSPDVAALLDRVGAPARLPPADSAPSELEALEQLRDNGFLVSDRQTERQDLDRFFTRVTSSTDELNITVLTTLQCNFACDYCYQGDRDDYNKFAEKMTLETAARVGLWIERELDRVQARALDADVLRRRAPAQCSGHVLPGGAGVAGRSRARGPADHRR